MKDLRSYHNAMGPEALAALVTDPANFTIVESTATRTQSTAAPGACAGPSASPAGSAVDFTDLDARRIHLEQPPPQPVPVFSLLSQQISTAGNLTVISAQAKGGKSAIVGAMIASIMAGPTPENDTDLPSTEPEHDLLGFTAAPHEGRAVVLFDTEQSPYDAWNLVNRSAQLAIAYACPVILVLHENPSGLETGKTRGHLGSQLERKAESNLRIAKDGKSGASMIFSERCRHACISRDNALRFAWSTSDGMHMTVEAETKESRAEAARQTEQPECQAVFAGHLGEISYTELKERIMTRAHLAERSAKRRIKQWQGIGLIKQMASGNYLRC